MRWLALRYPLWMGLCLSAELASAEPKAGSLPAAPSEKAPAKVDKPKTSSEKAQPPNKPQPGARKSAPAPKLPAKPAAAAEAELPKADADSPKTPAEEPSSRPAADVSRGAGSRSVTPPPAAPESAPAPKPAAASPAPTPAYGKGRPPAKPSPTLPPGSARGEPDEAARQHVTGGVPSSDALGRGKDDAELRSLRDAERALFPEPLQGLELGFDFAPPTSPDLDLSGLPAGTPHDGESAAATSEAAWLRSMSAPDLPMRFDERVVRYLHFYRDTPSGRTIAKTWAKKAGRYAPAIKAELRRAGLPTDLVWLSLIESGHNPTIASPAGAAGLWQFMPDAARNYGLTVDRWVDERLDPERSTQAAVRYLSDLYRRFGSWDLSMAAYNMGYAGLSRAIRKYSTNSFWELARYEAGIPWETTLYVPKILATAVLMNNRRAFGLDGIAEDPPERFDVIVVGPSTPLPQIARALAVPPETIGSLNPQYLAGRTPPVAPGAARTSYRVRVPEGGAGKWSASSARLTSDDELEPYVVKQGETVERIARAHGTSERALREANHVLADEVLAPGTVLLVPRLAQAIEPDPTTAPEVVVVPSRPIDYPDRKRVFYRVVSGDTTAGVAAAFHVSADELADWNTLDREARLEPGMSLQVFVAKTADLSKVLHVPEAHAKVLVAGTPEFSEYFEGQNGKRRLVVVVRDGDTLASIGKRYGMTVGQMERINRRGRADDLTPGDRVVVYTDRQRPAPGDKVL